MAGVSARIVIAGSYRGSSLDVADAAKVIENIQRDLNIALMNRASALDISCACPLPEAPLQRRAGGTKLDGAANRGATPPQRAAS